MNIAPHGGLSRLDHHSSHHQHIAIPRDCEARMLRTPMKKATIAGGLSLQDLNYGFFVAGAVVFGAVTAGRAVVVAGRAVAVVGGAGTPDCVL